MSRGVGGVPSGSFKSYETDDEWMTKQGAPNIQNEDDVRIPAQNVFELV